jgi:aspartate ammonia-lyase
MSALNAISTPAREVLLEALMCVAWADRVLVDEERSAASAAALGLGLVLPPDRDVTSPDRKPIQPEDLDVSALDARDRELVYLCAAWMAMADQVEDPQETKVLERLAERLELSQGQATWLHERASELRSKQNDGTSWWRAFNELVVEAARALNERRGSA